MRTEIETQETRDRDRETGDRGTTGRVVAAFTIRPFPLSLSSYLLAASGVFMGGVVGVAVGV